MDEMQRPIGVFDSGVGGISVLRELVALMPNENFIFYGDSKNAPYGTKTLEEVRKLTLADAEYLRSRNVKALAVTRRKGARGGMQHGDKRSDSHFKGKISERDSGHWN